nr:uncharacterized protein LOC105884543 [Microcebus murinus]
MTLSCQREDSESELLSDARDKLGGLVSNSGAEVSRFCSLYHSCLHEGEVCKALGGLCKSSHPLAAHSTSVGCDSLGVSGKGFSNVSRTQKRLTTVLILNVYMDLASPNHRLKESYLVTRNTGLNFTVYYRKRIQSEISKGSIMQRTELDNLLRPDQTKAQGAGQKLWQGDWLLHILWKTQCNWQKPQRCRDGGGLGVGFWQTSQSADGWS